MANLNLKGLWIPIEILTDKNLSDKEKTILSIILFLSKENNTCFCTNGTISELLNISSKQVSKLINSLKAKGYIAVTMKYKENSKKIDTRTIKPIQEKFNTSPSKVLYPSPTIVPYPMEQKVKDNKYIINNNKNNNKGYCNYEQRDYDKEGFDWNSLYANNNFTL